MDVSRGNAWTIQGDKKVVVAEGWPLVEVQL